MQPAAPLVMAAVLAVPAVARTPDLPGLPVCQDDRGRVVELQDQSLSGGHVLFWTATDRDAMGEMVLASCDTGRALRVRLGTAEGSLDSAAGFMRDAMRDEAPHTLSDIQANLRAEGYRATRGRISLSHCACDLARLG